MRFWIFFLTELKPAVIAVGGTDSRVGHAWVEREKKTTTWFLFDCRG